MNELFPPESVAMDSPRLAWLKRLKRENLIKTHYAPHCEEPWIAIVPVADDRALDVGEIDQAQAQPPTATPERK